MSKIKPQSVRFPEDAVLNYYLRRSARLDAKCRQINLDDEETGEEVSGGAHGNTRLPYGIAKGEGIDTQGMTPKEVWEALEGKGYSASEEYRKLKERNSTTTEKPRGEVVNTESHHGRLTRPDVTRIGRTAWRECTNMQCIDVTINGKNVFENTLYRDGEVLRSLDGKEEYSEMQFLRAIENARTSMARGQAVESLENWETKIEIRKMGEAEKDAFKDRIYTGKGLRGKNKQGFDDFANSLSESEKKLWLETAENTNFVIDVFDKKTANYNEETNTITFSVGDATMGRVIHELAHAMDKNSGNISDNLSQRLWEIHASRNPSVSRISEAMNAIGLGKYVDITRVAKPISIASYETTEFFDDWARKTGLSEKEGFKHVADLIEAATTGHVSAQHWGGHNREYYRGRGNVDAKEMWAEYAALRFTNNTEMLDLLKRTIPKTTQALEETYNSVFGISSTGGRAERGNIKDELMPKNSYHDFPEFKKLLKDVHSAEEKSGSLFKRMDELKNQLKSEYVPKPKSEWTKEDELDSILGDPPKIYTAKGKEIQEELAQVKKEWYESSKTKDAVREKFYKYNKRVQREARVKQKAEWKPEILVPTDKKDFEGFTTETTGTAFGDEMLQNGTIVEMSPKEYLQRCAFDIFDGTMESCLGAIDDKLVDEYAEKMKQGTKFDLPYLNYKGNSQEGRHRVAAAYKLGIDKVPVLIHGREQRRADSTDSIEKYNNRRQLRLSLSSVSRYQRRRDARMDARMDG